MEDVYVTTDKFDISYSENNAVSSMPSLHVHNAYEIYYLHDGVRTYIIDNKVYEVKKGNVALIRPNVFHKTRGDRYMRILINFSHAFLREFFTESAINQMLACFSQPVIVLTDEEQKEVSNLCERMGRAFKPGQFDERPLLLANLLTLLTKACVESVHDSEPLDTSNQLLSEILDYIGNNYKNIESLSEISGKFFITKFHLCRIFKDATSMSVFRYINTLKVQQACTMLSETNRSVTDISAECGFNSQVYFCKIFGEYMGMTPSAYRKKYKNKG